MMNWILLLVIVALASLAAWGGFRLSFVWTTKLCNRFWPVSETIAEEDGDIPSLDLVLETCMSRLALGIFAYKKLDELTEIKEQGNQDLARMQDPSYKKAFVIDGLRRKLNVLIEFFSDHCGDLAKAVSSLPDPLRSLYRSMLVTAEIVFEDVVYTEGYNLGTPDDDQIVLFDNQVSSAMDRLLSLLAKAEYESGFDEVIDEWGKALLQMHNWRARANPNAQSKTRSEFQSMVIGLLENKLSVHKFMEMWENGIWDTDDLADIGYFVAYIRRSFRRKTISSDRAPFAGALYRFCELYNISPELGEAIRSEMWAKKITPQVLGIIPMVQRGGRVSKNERRPELPTRLMLAAVNG